jgi:hypothetical protein
LKKNKAFYGQTIHDLHNNSNTMVVAKTKKRALELLDEIGARTTRYEFDDWWSDGGETDREEGVYRQQDRWSEWLIVSTKESTDDT